MVIVVVVVVVVVVGRPEYVSVGLKGEGPQRSSASKTRTGAERPAPGHPHTFRQEQAAPHASKAALRSRKLNAKHNTHLPKVRNDSRQMGNTHVPRRWSIRRPNAVEFIGGELQGISGAESLLVRLQQLSPLQSPKRLGSKQRQPSVYGDARDAVATDKPATKHLPVGPHAFKARQHGRPRG